MRNAVMQALFENCLKTSPLVNKHHFMTQFA